MSDFSRRRFLEDSLFAAAAAAFASSCASRGGDGMAAAPAPVASKVSAPSDRLRVAVIGVNGRGMAHVREWSGRQDAEIVAICDVDEKAFAKAAESVQKRTGK